MILKAILAILLINAWADALLALKGANDEKKQISRIS